VPTVTPPLEAHLGSTSDSRTVIRNRLEERTSCPLIEYGKTNLRKNKLLIPRILKQMFNFLKQEESKKEKTQLEILNSIRKRN